MQLQVERSFAGPPNMGHGGYVAGLLAARLDTAAGPVQVTLRRPIPLDTPLDLVETSNRVELRRGDDLIAEADAVDAPFELEVPPPPTLEQARAAEAASPSVYNDGRGVHPTCFGCGTQRDDDDGLRIHVGPVEVDGRAQVAGTWRPGAARSDGDGTVGTTWILAALDCPGAFAFIAAGTSAGLLGRIVLERYGDRPVRGDEDHVVTGWQIAVEGRKMFAGTALFAPDGALLAAARATWFGR
jgi:hypothetical protein